MYSHLVLIISIRSITTLELYANISQSDYCPDRNSCDPPSSHLVCMNHDPRLERGPNCKGIFKVTKLNITQANELLDWINGVRSQIACGNLEVKDDEILPRGYGMIRMQWDSELASLSIYMKSLCEEPPNYTRCLSTGRFKDVTFTRHYRNDNKNMTKRFIGFFGRVIKRIIPDHIYNFDIKQDYYQELAINLFQSGATHIGCSNVELENENYKDSKNKVYTFINCALPKVSETGKLTYNITPPSKGHGFSSVYGCPLHYVERDDCLCEEYRPKTTSTVAPSYPTDETKSGFLLNGAQWLWDIPKKLRPNMFTSETSIKPPCNNKKVQCEPKIVFVPIMAVQRIRTATGDRFVFKDNNMMSSITSTDVQISKTPSFFVNNPFKNMMTSRFEYMTTRRYEYMTTSRNDYMTTSRNDYMTTSRNQYMTTRRNKYITPSRNDHMTTRWFDYMTTSRNDYMTPSRNEYMTTSKNEHRTTRKYEPGMLFEPYVPYDEQNEFNLKTPEKILESIEEKTMNSLEKIVNNYHNNILDRNRRRYGNI